MVEGNAILHLLDVATGERAQIELSAKEPRTVYVPPRVAHLFVNASNTETMMLLAYSDRKYDSQGTVAADF